MLTTTVWATPPKEQKTPLRQDLTDLVKNRPWLIMLTLTVLVFITLALKGGMTIYFFKYYLSEASQTAFLQQIGFGGFLDSLSNTFGEAAFMEFRKADSAPYATSSIANAASTIAMILGIFLSKPLADKYGKRNVFGWFLTLSAICLMAIVTLSTASVWGMVVLLAIHGFIYGITIPLLWAMIADVADFSEWKNNRRATAIIFSAMIFGLKVGLSLGGAISAWLLSIFGYNADAVQQTPEAVNGIKMLVSVIPGAVFIAGACLLFFYKIDKKTEIQIEAELKLRRA